MCNMSRNINISKLNKELNILKTYFVLVEPPYLNKVEDSYIILQNFRIT